LSLPSQKKLVWGHPCFHVLHSKRDRATYQSVSQSPHRCAGCLVRCHLPWDRAPQDFLIGLSDRDDFLKRLEAILGETQNPCYAWALMPNHFYLLLRTGNTPYLNPLRARQVTSLRQLELRVPVLVRIQENKIKRLIQLLHQLMGVGEPGVNKGLQPGRLEVLHRFFI